MTSGSAPPRAAPSGLHYMVLAALFFSVMSLLVKLVGQRIPSQEVVLFRAVVTLVISAALLRRAGISFVGHRKGLLVLRGLLGFGGLSCFFYALVHLPLAEATVIQYTNPVLTALLAAVILREGLAGRELLALGISLLGVVVVARPAALFGGAAAPYAPFAVAVAFGGALFSAAAYTTVRKLGETEHPLVVVLYFPLVAAPAALPTVIPVWVWPSPFEWVLLLGVGVATQFAQVFMTRGLQLERAGRATGVTYLQIVFAVGWGILVFGEWPDGWTVAGALLVALGTLLLARRRTA